MLKSRRSLFPDRRAGGLALALRRGGSRALAVGLAGLVLLGLGCGSAEQVTPPPAAPAAAADRGPPVMFELATLDKKTLSTASLSGRISIIAFVASYDTASHAQARFVGDLARSHKPRINAALLILEPPENKPMAEAFAAALDLPFPMAMADPATLAGQGPFKGLHHVPSVVILDREGREAYRRVGLIEKPALEKVLRDVERTSPPPRPIADPPPADSAAPPAAQ